MKALLFLFICSQFISGCIRHKEENRKPNILFISVDDLRPDLGAYGNKEVKTPYLDKLASEGILFKNHFVQVPTCGASRHALLTGFRPRTKAQLSNQVTVNEISNQIETERPETFIHLLRQNGYYTVGIGKISHSADGFVYGYEEEVSKKRELPYSWDELLFDSGKWETGWNAFFGYANGENRQSLKKKVKPYEAGMVEDDGYPDGLTTQLAISKLKELKMKSQPFFLGVGLFKPHLPFNSPAKYWDMYDSDSITISLNPNIPENVNKASLHQSNEFNQYLLTDEKASLEKAVSEEYARKLRQAYYAAITYVDHQIGEIIGELKSLGLVENTIIVVWGDHGWHLGDQQVWGKHTLFDNSLRSALIMKIPESKSDVVELNAIVEAVDIYPSLMELCEIDLPYTMDGESFLDLINNSTNQKEQVAYSYYNQGISLRTDKYRLTKYYRKEEPIIELYDHRMDPFESKNIFLEESDVVDKLMPLLEKGNTGLYAKSKDNSN